MNKLTGLFVLVALASVSTARAQGFASQDYTFVGTVTSSNDPLIADGSRIVGSYAINLNNVTLDPSWNLEGNVDGTIQAGAPWSFYLPAGYGGSIFTATAKVDGTILSTPGGSASSVAGGQYIPGLYSAYSASNGADSFSVLVPNASTSAFVLGVGLPSALTAQTMNTGKFVTANADSVTYSVTSLTAKSAPELDVSTALAALTLLCGAVVVLKARTRAS